MRRLVRPKEVNASIRSNRQNQIIEKHALNRNRFKNEKHSRPKIGKRKKREMIKQQKGDAFYSSREWLAIRYTVIKRYGRKCMVCFRTNIEMHVDHINPRSIRPDLALNFHNLQVLCRDCNKGKGNTDSIDWRPKSQTKDPSHA